MKNKNKGRQKERKGVRNKKKNENNTAIFGAAFSYTLTSQT